MRAALGVIAAAFVFASGCAQKDWIDRTLVTESVTGVWEGSMATSSGQPSFHQEIRLELEQKGPNVKGLFLGYGGAGPHGTMPIEGSMAGDQCRFRNSRGTLTGELTVGGDEMTGQGMAYTNRAVTYSLRRINSGVPPR